MNRVIPILITMLILTISGNMPSFAYTYEDSDNPELLATQGFSKYFAKIAVLQKDKMEDINKEPIPSKFNTFWKHVIWGDFCCPANEFGYYEISPRD